MTQGFNTNFYKVFEEILTMYNKYNLSPSDMPEQIICISDMQFDAAHGNPTIAQEANIDNIDTLYRQQGLVRPKLIFWNVAANTLDFPTTEEHKNTCLISGFSPSILSAFTTSKEFSASVIMNEIINSDRYTSVRTCLERV